MRRNRFLTIKIGTALVLGLLSPVHQLPSAHATGSIESLEVFADAVGRAGGAIKVEVFSKLSPGTTQVADQIAIGIYGVVTGTHSYGNNFDYPLAFARTNLPTSVSNGIAHYSFEIPAPLSAGYYQLRYCASSKNESLVYSDLRYPAVENDYWNRNKEISCKSIWAPVGSVPTKVFLAHRDLSAKPAAGSSTAIAESSAKLFDATGMPTILSGQENLVLASSSAQMTANYGVALSPGARGLSESYRAISFDHRHGDADGFLRYRLSDSPGKTSLITAFLSETTSNLNWDAPNAKFTFRTEDFTNTGAAIQIANSSIASGTDGKAYIWSSFETRGHSATPLYQKVLNKPLKLDFNPTLGSVTNTRVKDFFDSTYGFTSVLSDDGRLYLPPNTFPQMGWSSNNLFLSNSNRQALAGGLQPLAIPALSDLKIVSGSEDLSHLLDDQGRVWVRRTSNFERTTDFELLDLSSIGSPKITSVESNNGTLLLLDDAGKIYSSGSNAGGILGQGIGLANGGLAQIVLPESEFIQEISLRGSPLFAVAISKSGNYWIWGSNLGGQIGKDPASVTTLDKPALGILPVGVSVFKWVKSANRIAFIAADQETVYAPKADGAWYPIALSYVLDGEKATNLLAQFNYYSDYVGIYWILTATNTGKLVKSGWGIPRGDCSSLATYTNNSTNRIRSIGQFGPVSTDDAIKYAGIFRMESGTATAINTTISAVVSKPITVQVAQLRTNCYEADELEFRWDPEGDGTYGDSVLPSLGVTGYQTLSVDLSYSTPGRKTLALKIRTPDEVDYFLTFVVGVDPVTTPDLPKISTARTRVVTNGISTLALSNADLYAWGSNYASQLGIPGSQFSQARMPIKVSLPEGLEPERITPAGEFTYLIDESGKVWGFGNRFYLTGSGPTTHSPVEVNFLKNRKIRDIQIGNFGVALESTGKLIYWTWNGAGAFTPVPVVELAGIQISQFLLQSSNGQTRLIAIDRDGQLWIVPYESGEFKKATKETRFTGVEKLSWNGTSAVAITGTKEVWFAVDSQNPFALVTPPQGKAPIDAMFHGVMYLQDEENQIWTASASQSGANVIMSTWTKYAQQQTAQANAADVPILQGRGSRYISFSSGNLLYIGSIWDQIAGRCESSSGINNGDRVFSTGQFGAPNIDDSISATGYIAISSQNQAQFASGQFFPVNPKDPIVIKMFNPRSNCFNNANQMSADADLDGSGDFMTPVPLSNEGNGTFAFTFSAEAPESGKRDIAVKISTPAGSYAVYRVGLGVLSNKVIPELAPRNNPTHTSSAAAFTIADDGFAYGWSTPNSIASNYYNGSTMAFMNMITSTPPRNPGLPTKLELPGNPKIREAIPFTSCCAQSSGRSIFGALVVDENGKTYVWGTDSSLNAATGYPWRSTPTTPTEIPALKGVDVVRISASPDGSRALALSSTGAVYEWHTEDGSNMTYTAPVRVAALAGLEVVDIFASNRVNIALTKEGDVYTFNGYRTYLGRPTGENNYGWIYSFTAGKVEVGEEVVEILPLADQNFSMVKTASDKLFMWGYFYNPATGSYLSLLEPTEVKLPGNRTPITGGTVHYENFSSNVIAATDGTWWSLTGDAQNKVTAYQRSLVPQEINSALSGFARGNGQAVQTSNGSIWTTSSAVAGTCGPISTFTRVMSNGQLGPEHKADQVFISVSGNEITRPNTPATVQIMGWSACDGGIGITFAADLDNTGVFDLPTAGTVTIDGATSSKSYTFTKTRNGPTYLNFKVTSQAGLSNTSTFFTKVIPAPLPGRQIGISINDGNRYTNSSNVILNLVWPDGTTKIFVSNDGGFAPGTVQSFDLQYTIPWVLPPQAVIPLPSIVYARFDNDPNTYYFDDIILDSISPTLTFVQSK